MQWIRSIALTAAGIDHATGVQTAVDSGDPEIMLDGIFNFGNGRVLITKSVSIYAGRAGGKIKGGGGLIGGKPSGVFDVLAPGQTVSINRMRFEGARLFAIRVAQVGTLTIDQCVISNMQTVFANNLNIATGISVGTPDGMPRSGFGVVNISNNQIDLGGTSTDNTLGILLNNAGTDGTNARPINAHITANQIKNVTAFGIDCRNVIGTVTIDGTNVITPGQVGASQPPGLQVAAIRCLGTTGSAGHTLKNNTIKCGFAGAAGIRCVDVSSGGLIDSNEISMSLPQGFTAADENAGIELRGSCVGVQVLRNRISGTARAALTLIAQSQQTPKHNSLLANTIDLFTPIPGWADIDIEPDVQDTLVSYEVEKTTYPASLGTVFDDASGTTFIGPFTVLHRI